MPIFGNLRRFFSRAGRPAPPPPPAAVSAYSLFGDDVFSADAVQAAIDAIASELKKLTPMHTRKGARDVDTQLIADSRVARVLEAPNEVMTTSDMIERVVWRLYTSFNAFLIPTWEGGPPARRLTGLYPISPDSVRFEMDPSERLFVAFGFKTGYEAVLPYADVIHLRHRYSLHEYLGGNAWGEPDTKALAGVLRLDQRLLEGLSVGLGASASLFGAVRYNTMLDDGTMEARVRDFERRLAANESGLLLLDLKSEFIPFRRDVRLVDAETLRLIDSRILRMFRVSPAILSGDYTKEQFAAFSQSVLEPKITSLNQAFTRTLFTDAERARGNAVTFYQNELILMTTAEKLEYIASAGAMGALYLNEIRKMFGQLPDAEIVGARLQSLNFVEALYARDYQLGAEGGRDGQEE